MARILTCTRALSHQLTTGQRDTRLPVSFHITPERLEKVGREAPDLFSDRDRSEMNELNDAVEVKLDLGTAPRAVKAQ